MPISSKKVFGEENGGELMVIEPNKSHPSSQPLAHRSGGTPLPSQSDSGLCDLIVIGSRAFSLAILKGGPAVSVRREPNIGLAFVVTSFSRQVIHSLVWRICGGFVVSQAVIPFPAQVTKLNRRNIFTDNGSDLLRAAYKIFGRASFFDLVMFPFLGKRMIDNLLDLNVPCADLFKTKVTDIAQ
ncbi:hypothetical protein AMTRI_Chr06g173740 [Amborella trichopoda]